MLVADSILFELMLTTSTASNDLTRNDGVLQYGNDQLIPGGVENQGINFGDLLWNFQWFDANSLWTDNSTL